MTIVEPAEAFPALLGYNRLATKPGSQVAAAARVYPLIRAGASAREALSRLRLELPALLGDAWFRQLERATQAVARDRPLATCV